MKKYFLFGITFILFSATVILAQNTSFMRNENHPGIKFGGSEIVSRDLVTLTHSASQTIVAETGIHCGTQTTPSYHTPNSYWRSFNLTSFDITENFQISSVQFGIESATGNTGTQPVTVNLYTSSQAFPAGYPSSLTLIGTADMSVTDQALTIASVDISAEAPAGSELVVEIFTPDGQDPVFNVFYIGGNAEGQTAPSFISASECGIDSPTDLAAIGFAESHMVINVVGEQIVPVELTSFNAVSVKGSVSLSWQTATETNNYGFEVERKANDQQYSKVGFIAGHGTTTEMKSYSFVDNSVASGSFSYRLKQIDLDGSVNYSNEVEVLVKPSSFSLAQNYPNPFNPSTKIDFALASDSKVTLKIFNVLGQEVATLLNGNLSAGNHTQLFDAAHFNSGVYFYTIEASGVDGKNFSATKKMILTK